MPEPVHRHLLLLGGVVGAVYGLTLGHGFVWDDYPLLVASGAYTRLDLVRFFTTPANGLEYLPLRDLSYALDHLVWGLNPFGFHLTNLLLYFLNVVAVYLLGSSAVSYLAAAGDGAGSRPPATVGLWTALLFAVHPLHSEAATFVTGRNTLLSGLFVILSARFFLDFLQREPRRWGSYLAALGCFVLALLAKATAIFLPVLLLLCPFLGRRRSVGIGTAAVVPFIAVAGAASLLFTRIARQTGVIDPLLARHGGLALQRLAEAFQIPFFYLGKLLLPVALVPDYPVTFAPSPTAPVALLALAGILVGISVAVAGRRRLPWFSFGLCWYGAALLPVLHVLPTAATVADRYAYLPSVAFCFLLAAGGVQLAARLRRPTVMAAFGGVVVLVWGGLTLRQNRVWQSDETLWEHTARVAPTSLKALDNLGWIFFIRGDFDRAAGYLERARRLAPDDPVVAFFDGYLAFERREYEAARRLFKAAYARRNDFVDALYYIAKSAEAAGERAEAVEYYRKVMVSPAPESPYYRQRAAERLQALGER